MTFDEMCTFVRLHADADATDAPTATLTVYARMAYNDILSRRTAWPHLEVNYTLTTVSGQAEYLFTGLNVADMDRVLSVIDNSQIGFRLTYITRGDADILFGTPTAPYSSNASAYTISQDSRIVLFPTPSATGKTYRVYGLRSQAAWPTTSGSIADLPRVFDEAICWFMIAQYYASQEDQQLSAMYLNEYETIIRHFVAVENGRAMSPRPMVVGGNNQGFAPRWIDRVRGSLE